jgi:hypothetical protein
MSLIFRLNLKKDVIRTVSGLNRIEQQRWKQNCDGMGVTEQNCSRCGSNRSGNFKNDAGGQ